MADDPQSALDNEWCSIAEAARRLGVTPTAIRNRVTRGTLESKANGNFGRLVRVPLTVPEPVMGTVMETVRVTVPEPVSESPVDREFLDDLRSWVGDLQTRLEASEAERLEERERVAALTERVIELTARASSAEALVAERGEEIERLRYQLQRRSGLLEKIANLVRGGATEKG